MHKRSRRSEARTVLFVVHLFAFHWNNRLNIVLLIFYYYNTLQCTGFLLLFSTFLQLKYLEWQSSFQMIEIPSFDFNSNNIFTSEAQQICIFHTSLWHCLMCIRCAQVCWPRYDRIVCVCVTQGDKYIKI